MENTGSLLASAACFVLLGEYGLGLSFSGSLLPASIGSVFRASPGLTHESPDMDESLLVQYVRPKCRAVRAGARESKVLLPLIVGLGSIISPMQDRCKISIKAERLCGKRPSCVSSCADSNPGLAFERCLPGLRRGVCHGLLWGWGRGFDGCQSHSCMGSAGFSNGVALSESYIGNTIHICKPPAARCAP